MQSAYEFSGLDVLTHRGRQTLEDEKKVALWIARKGFVYAQTPKDAPAKVDAVLIKENKAIALLETKCRYGFDLEALQTKFENEWLVTAEKIESGLKIAEGLCIPFWGMLYLVNCDTLLVQSIKGAQIRYAETETQATVNGGVAIRKNAFIKMDKAKVYRNISAVGDAW